MATCKSEPQGTKRYFPNTKSPNLPISRKIKAEGSDSFFFKGNSKVYHRGVFLNKVKAVNATREEPFGCNMPWQ